MGSIIIRYIFLKYHSEKNLSHRKSRVESRQLAMRVLQYLREREMMTVWTRMVVMEEKQMILRDI